VIPMKTQKLSLFIYVVLFLMLAAGALLYTKRVRADGQQQAPPDVKLTEQMVAGEVRGGNVDQVCDRFSVGEFARGRVGIARRQGRAHGQVSAGRAGK